MSNSPIPSSESFANWHRIIPAARCREGAGTFIEYAGRELGVFVLADDEVHVIDNACPHSGGNLSAGEVRDGVVTCPLHGWEFALRTGFCVDSSVAVVVRYPARIRDGWVEIQLEPSSGCAGKQKTT